MDYENLYSFWRGLKSIFQFSGWITPDAAHIHFGLISFFAFYYIFKRTKRPEITAWFLVCAFELLNEIIDIFFDYRISGDIREWNAIRDFISTLFWPSIFTAYLIYRRHSQKISN